MILFALYISFNKYDIFASPQRAGLDNYVKALSGFWKSSHKDFAIATQRALVRGYRRAGTDRAGHRPGGAPEHSDAF